MGLGEILELIYGLQLLTRKIFGIKQLWVPSTWDRVPSESQKPHPLS